MPLLVTRAASDDVAEAARITVAAYVGTYVAADDAYVAHLQDAAGRATQAELWVARLEPDGPVVGSVTFCPPESSMREIARDDEAEFRMLAVDPVARGRGVGEALVRHCVEEARRLGLRGVRMSTMAQMTSAHRLYERLGFERAPDDDWSPTPGVHLLAYARRDVTP